MTVRVYAYSGCDTCRRALRFLQGRGVTPTVIPIREQPPTRAELKRMLGHVGGDLRRLFNTSGRDYRGLGLSERLPAMTPAQAIALLAAHGNLVKRPFLLAGSGGAVGFNEDEWRQLV